MDKTLTTLTFEFRRLSEKKLNEAVNEFKLNIVNKILAEANKEKGSLNSISTPCQQTTISFSF